MHKLALKGRILKIVELKHFVRYDLWCVTRSYPTARSSYALLTVARLRMYLVALP